MVMTRILIVDDHEAVRWGLRSIVSEHKDWSVCGEAIDGMEAVEKARESRPDVVLMDVSMPRMDGLQATRQILEERPETMVILVSQNDPVMVVRQASEVRAHGFVEKSAVSEKLVSKIEELLEARRKDGAPRREGQEPGQTWLFGGGALGEMILERDWSQTVLGAIDTWPPCLRTAVNLMLNSQHPMWIGWGREMAFLYNDAYVSVLSAAKHPWALGKPASEVWAEIWDVCGPLADKVFSRGEPSFVDNVQLFMKRGERLEETYYSFSYSPIYDESGKVGGLFCPSAETTGQILHTRRLQTLSELSSKALVEKSTQASCASFLRTLETNPDDIPFAALYLLDAEGREARLAGTSRIHQGLGGITPAVIPVMDEGREQPNWPMREVVGSLKPVGVLLEETEELPRGPANQAVREAVALPLISPGQEGAFGVLLLGVNPTRKLDAEYRTFFSLVTDQLVTAVEMHRVRQEASEAARRSEERLRALVNASSYVVYRMNPDWTEMRQLDGNGFISDTAGPSKEWLQRYIHPDDQPLLLEKIQEAVKSKSLFELEHRVRRADGTLGWTLSRAVPLLNANGEITEWFGTASDVTVRHQTEENLREHRERLAAIVTSTQDAIISKDLNGVVTSWNEGAEMLFEYSAKEAIGQPITMIIPEELHAEEREILSRLRRGERIDHYETVRRTKSGARRRVSLTISPLRNQAGRVIGASKIARDITERVRADEATKEAELSGRLLQLQDEERRRIARELHDGAGQLLAAVGMNLASLTREKGRLSAEGARAVEETTALLEQAIAEIRTTSHLLHPPLLDEVGLKSALTEYVEGFTERSKIQATLDLPEDLGELPADHELSLFRIVQECLTNVHRHSKSATALVRLTQSDHEIQLEVRDEGRGISPEVQEKFIAGTSAGVGLRGMRERVRQIGGSLQIQSDQRGTTVKAVLPIRERQPGERLSASGDD